MFHLRIFTLYTRTLPLDVACRVWDMFCRDGEVFLFRTALGIACVRTRACIHVYIIILYVGTQNSMSLYLGIIRMFQNEVLMLHSIEEVGQLLGHLPTNLSSDQLFAHISAIHLTDKKFYQTLAQFNSSKKDVS